MDSLDIMDKFYEKKYQDMETRLYRLYDEIEGVENSIEEVKNRLLNIRQQKISEENVYQFLLYFDKSFNRFLIISLDVLICRYSPLLRAFPALFISEEPHKSFYYPSCFHSQK